MGVSSSHPPRENAYFWVHTEGSETVRNDDRPVRIDVREQKIGSALDSLKAIETSFDRIQGKPEGVVKENAQAIYNGFMAKHNARMTQAWAFTRWLDEKTDWSGAQKVKAVYDRIQARNAPFGSSMQGASLEDAGRMAAEMTGKRIVGGAQAQQPPAASGTGGVLEASSAEGADAAKRLREKLESEGHWWDNLPLIGRKGKGKKE